MLLEAPGDPKWLNGMKPIWFRFPVQGIACPALHGHLGTEKRDIGMTLKPNNTPLSRCTSPGQRGLPGAYHMAGRDRGLADLCGTWGATT